MNNLVFNNTAKKLNAIFYGLCENEYIPIAVDENGLFLFSPLGAISVTADNLDIRHLNASVDSVTVTASNLDIRNLNGNQDSVAVSSKGFVEQTVTQTVSSGANYLLMQEISGYSENSFFIRNVSGGSLTVKAQVSPVENTIFFEDDSEAKSVSAGRNAVVAVKTPMKYARLSVEAGSSAQVIAYYNGRA